MLGGSVLKLEVSDDDISECIDMAYDKVKPYLQDEVFLTKGWASVLDLTEDRVVDVIRVLRASGDISDIAGKQFDFEAVKIDRRSIVKNVIGSYPIIDEEIRFKFINNKLYLDANTVTTGLITIEAMVDPDLELLKDEQATQWIYSYALALAKQICGRIRSKFKSGNIPIELDGDSLLSEAQQELERLETELNERQFGPLFVSGDNKS